jgi:heme/copper-type cytochrome/quinol oxidase subunit 2
MLFSVNVESPAQFQAWFSQQEQKLTSSPSVASAVKTVKTP